MAVLTTNVLHVLKWKKLMRDHVLLKQKNFAGKPVSKNLPNNFRKAICWFSFLFQDCGCAKNTCIDCDPRPKPVNPKPVDGRDVKHVGISN